MLAGTAPPFTIAWANCRASRFPQPLACSDTNYSARYELRMLLRARSGPAMSHRVWLLPGGIVVVRRRLHQRRLRSTPPSIPSSLAAAALCSTTSAPRSAWTAVAGCRWVGREWTEGRGEARRTCVAFTREGAAGAARCAHRSSPGTAKSVPRSALTTTVAATSSSALSSPTPAPSRWLLGRGAGLA